MCQLVVVAMTLALCLLSPEGTVPRAVPFLKGLGGAGLPWLLLGALPGFKETQDARGEHISTGPSCSWGLPDCSAGPSHLWAAPRGAAGWLPALVFPAAAFVACRSPLSATLLPKVTLPEQFHQSLASCDVGSKPR